MMNLKKEKHLCFTDASLFLWREKCDDGIGKA